MSKPAPQTPGGIKPRLVRRDPRRLTRLKVNARYMKKEEYDRLVANVRRDGCLTSIPLIYSGGEHPEGEELILSGNHRCDAAVDADLTEIDAMLIDTPLSRQQLLAIQLSHNAIAGHDDPATLRQLYDELDDVDWRGYSGLDDQQLALLADVNTEGLSEANLDFATIQLVFLPTELDAARAAFDLAKTAAAESWLAASADYDPTLNALETAHGAYKVGNVATALRLILAVYESHLDDLQDGYLAPDGEPSHPGDVGLETVFGSRVIPAKAAAILVRAIKAATKAKDIEPGKPWQLLAQLADAYLTGLAADRSARQAGTE